MTYAEFLAQQGASAEEIKILDTPVARKAYEKMEAATSEAAAARKRAEEKYAQNVEWGKEVEKLNQGYLKERDTAVIEAAKANAAFQKMQELGLLQVAENLEPGSTQPKPGETPAFDPKTLERYVDRDTFLGAVDQEGNAIALVQDIASEHQLLFGNDPSKRLNWRAMRAEAKERKMNVEQLWMEKYNVPSARTALAAKEKSEYEARIASDAITKYKSEHPETNPLMAVPTISRTPFTGRVPSASDASKPWLKSEGEREQARLAKVLPKIEQMGPVN
jgi:hypothetical protein